MVKSKSKKANSERHAKHPFLSHVSIVSLVVAPFIVRNGNIEGGFVILERE
jgi:hypothetical protein